MKGKGINYNFARFSIIEEAISRVTSAITNYVERSQAELAETKRQLTEKRQAQSEYHQEMVDGMPLEERLKMGNHRY